MPRARSQVLAILDRLSLVRGNIVALNVTLQQVGFLHRFTYPIIQALKNLDTRY